MSPATQGRPLAGKAALVTGGSRIMRAMRAEQFSGYERLKLVDHAKPAVSAGAVRRAIAEGSFVVKGDAGRTVDAMISAADSAKPAPCTR